MGSIPVWLRCLRVLVPGRTGTRLIFGGEMKSGPKRDRCPYTEEELKEQVRLKGVGGVAKDLGKNRSTVNRWLKRRS